MRNRGFWIGLTGLFVCCSVSFAQTDKLPTHKDLAYVANGHERQKLDLYLPKQDANAAPLPLIVWIHGGGWIGGSKANPPALFLTEKGYAVASLHYRFSNHAIYPAQLEDCKAALRFLRAEAKKYNLDKDRVGVWGASAGGHLSSLLGTTGDVKELEGAKLGHPDQSSRVQVVVNWFGPTEMATMPTDPANRASQLVAGLLGGTPADKKELASQASPLSYVTKDDAPTLLMHGDKDALVPVEQAKKLAEALQKVGVPVKLQIYEGAGHGGPAFNTPEAKKLIEDFFATHLKTKSK